jgi:hypothetical protein
MPLSALGRAIGHMLNDEELLLLNNDPSVPMTPREHRASMRRLREHQALVQPNITAPKNTRARGLQTHAAHS